MLDIKITRSEVLKELPEGALGFGKYFTDHMFIMNYDNGAWHDPRIIPYGPIPMDPASSCLHYGSEIFEGLKAYLTDKGEVQLFRPYENAKRFNDSADRLCLPKIDEEIFVSAIKALVDIDRRWIPTEKGTSLYIRPFMYGDDHTLGVHGVKSAVFVIILSPSGSYYKNGLNPVDIMVETEDIRVPGKGGTGYAKCGGNYAASARAGKKAEEKGYSQVLWLDATYRKYIEEVGAMNIMFKINGKVVTPALVGSILPGITRKSVIEILKDKNIDISEERISVDDLKEALIKGEVEEVFGTGTAAVISPVGMLEIEGVQYIINDKKIGPISQMLYDEITGIQSGRIKDKYNWTVKL